MALPSSTLLKNGREIYVYGTIGIALRVFKIKIQKIPYIELTVESSSAIDVAGVLGVIVVFRLATFVARAIHEIAESRLGKWKAAQDELRDTKDIADLGAAYTGDPKKAHLEHALRTYIRRLSLFRVLAGAASSVIEIVLPMLFGCIAVAVLFRPAVAFLKTMVGGLREVLIGWATISGAPIVI